MLKTLDVYGSDPILSLCGPCPQEIAQPTATTRTAHGFDCAARLLLQSAEASVYLMINHVALCFRHRRAASCAFAAPHVRRLMLGAARTAELLAPRSH